MKERNVQKQNGAPDGAFRLSRELAAPRETVFEAWTRPEMLEKWWGPQDFKNHVESQELRPGGIFLYSMEVTPGNTMWGRFVYREIAAPGRLVFVVSFSDENAGITRAPFEATYPLEVLSTLTLDDAGEGRTLMHLHSVPENATAEEEQTFRNFNASMQQGWGGTIDQLEKFLQGQVA
jgi:uncharacterized protein YndB with AHSA1/START domain